jgi:hypothetical protein
MNNIERRQPSRAGLPLSVPGFGVMDLGEPSAANRFQLPADLVEEAKRRFVSRDRSRFRCHHRMDPFLSMKAPRSEKREREPIA